MKKITIIAQTLDNDIYNYQEAMKPLLDNGKLVSNWWYLHGKLEYKVGYDKGIIVSHEHLLKKNIKWINESNKSNKSKHPQIGRKIYMNSNPDSIYYLPDGMYEVEILEIDKPCIGYFWTHFKQYDNIIGDYPEMHGLVVFKDDIEGNEFAFEKYKEKACTL